ncbi:MAG: hypothetical protein Q8T11_09690 [Elusimicrobiota bacterium]|nr:hypothetical protein [Elusimicrobiota bacterium]
MNDDIREKLSAYLDGALSDLERKTLEGELSRSEEMRLELEALRAVSAAVKGLPKEPLPVGFAARLDARRAREGAPEREYFILPPAYRPLAFALSTAVVALVVWDRTVTKPDVMAPRAGWDSEVVSVKSAADAPPSIDVTGAVSAENAGQPQELAAKKEEAAMPSTLGKQLSAPGKPLEIAEDRAPSAPAAAPSRLIPDGALSKEQSDVLDNLPDATGAGGGAMIARNEEERSAINERLYKGFEEEKKRMGIAKIMERDEESDKLSTGGREFMALQASPEAARVDGGRASIGSVRGAARSKAGAPAVPAVKALTLKSPEALAAAWAGAGLAGDPPAVNFPEQMAVFLAGPEGCGIVSVRSRKNTLLVLYKSEGFDEPAARVRAVALSSKPVLLKLAE